MPTSLPDRRIPTRIDPCPIIEAVVELQFEPSVDPDAVYGILYSQFSAEFSQTERLAILDIPSPIRRSDADLKYQPHYKLKNHNFILQIGSHVASLVTQKEYCGWSVFKPKLLSVFGDPKTQKLFKSLRRFGFRYINWFDFDVFEKMTLSLQLDGQAYSAQATALTTMFTDEKLRATVRVSNDAKVNTKPNPGSILDIDVQLQPVEQGFLNNLEAELERAHSFEKKVFFSLLKQDFIDTLNPEYE